MTADRRSRIARVMIVFLACWLSAASASPLFEDDGVLDIELSGPLDSLIENSPRTDELDFTLRSGGVDQPVKVRLRGKSRIRVCDFPPIRLRFADAGHPQTAFSGQYKLRLVTHCRPSDSSEINVLEEYIAYRAFSLLSEVSYRVRLLRISYLDDSRSGSQHAGTRYGFAIEHRDELLSRIGGARVSVPGVPLKRLNHEQEALVYVFQYLIGNTDWSLVLADGDDDCCHNVDLIGRDGEIFMIPYDFDLAGIVNAAYAKPDPSLKLRSVRKRKYRGYCSDMAELRNAIQTVNSREEQFFDIVRQTPGLTQKERKSTEKYLADFFKKSKSGDKLARSMEKQCVG